MTPAELEAAGERLYGAHWRKPLADALCVSVSTIDKMRSGARRITERSAKQIEGLSQSPRTPVAG